LSKCLFNEIRGYGFLHGSHFQRFMRQADEEGHDRRAGEKYVREN